MYQIYFRSYYLLIGLCMLLCIQCSPDIEGVEEVLPNVFKSEPLFLESTLDVPRRSEGDILLLSDSSLLLVYTKFTGGAGDHSWAILVKRTSTDKGESWSEEEVVVSGEGRMNVMSASLLKLDNGAIALFYLVKNSNTDCFPSLRFSYDNGNSWSRPVHFIQPGSGYFTLNNSRVIQLSSGRIVLPIAQYMSVNGGFLNKTIISCYYSDDLGVTWKQGKTVPVPAIKTQEPGVVELPSGRLLMYIRTDQGAQYFSYSKDQGVSWSLAEKSTLVSPLSPASIVKTPGGKSILAVWNMSATERMPLCMAISNDEGKTWKKKVILENKANYWACYPAIEFLSSTDIFVMYSISLKEQWGLGSLKLIRVKYY